jgi:hypothetical protein
LEVCDMRFSADWLLGRRFTDWRNAEDFLVVGVDGFRLSFLWEDGRESDGPLDVFRCEARLGHVRVSDATSIFGRRPVAVERGSRV